jgi:hypothetical protein
MSKVTKVRKKKQTFLDYSYWLPASGVTGNENFTNGKSQWLVAGGR